MIGVQRANLSGGRLHLQHGPIDLVIGAEGAGRDLAYDAAQVRLGTVLAELMAEIDLLRMSKGARPQGAIARVMWDAVRVHAGVVTPMAAVAGAVAQSVLAAMLQVSGADLTRAYVNNGGDIALHLGKGARFDVAMSGLQQEGLGRVTIDATAPVRGIATSGQGGRSLSFGIAESVTVLAATAAQADVAATLIAGAVDLPGHRSVARAPAEQVRDGSDLGARLVVTRVGALVEPEIALALQSGQRLAHRMQGAGLIESASLHLLGQSVQVAQDMKRILHDA
jgi:ApbE superfamily uncharacterized protein (UPF0280 family)